MSFSSAAPLISNSLSLLFVAGIPLYAFIRKVKVYESFITGAKDGIGIIIKIVPYLVGMVVAIGMFRASGGFELIGQWLTPILPATVIPPDILPLALMRSLSGGATNAMAVEVINAHGGDSYISRLAATLMGSTDTTFYIIAVYFGSVSVYRTRHAIPAGLIADFVSIVAAVFICSIVFS